MRKQECRAQLRTSYLNKNEKSKSTNPRYLKRLGKKPIFSKTSKQWVGVVVSDKMLHTRVVAVTRKILHKKYKKVITRTKRYLVHDTKHNSSLGDLVKFAATRPISKRKRWILTQILENS
jgi:small subunit ribosomal protein S17